MTAGKPDIIEHTIAFVVGGVLVVFTPWCTWWTFYQPAIMFYSWLFGLDG